MRILGIDPGTGILGFGVVDVKDASPQTFSMVDAGVVRTPAHTPHDERLEDIFNSLTEIIEALVDRCTYRRTADLVREPGNTGAALRMVDGRAVEV